MLKWLSYSTTPIVSGTLAPVRFGTSEVDSLVDPTPRAITHKVISKLFFDILTD